MNNDKNSNRHMNLCLTHSVYIPLMMLQSIVHDKTIVMQACEKCNLVH